MPVLGRVPLRKLTMQLNRFYADLLQRPAAAQIDAELCRLLDPHATVTVANASQKAPETPSGAPNLLR